MQIIETFTATIASGVILLVGAYLVSQLAVTLV